MSFILPCLASFWAWRDKGPGTVKIFFETWACLIVFLFGPELLTFLDWPCFTSRSDQDSKSRNSFLNKFTIISTFQPMNSNQTRQAGAWTFFCPRAGSSDTLESFYSSPSSRKYEGAKTKLMQWPGFIEKLQFISRLIANYIELHKGRVAKTQSWTCSVVNECKLPINLTNKYIGFPSERRIRNQ